MYMIRTMAIGGLLAMAATTAQATEMTAPDADDLARWAAANAEIEAMSPTWGVQGRYAFKACSDASVPVFYLDVRTDAECAEGYVEN